MSSLVSAPLSPAEQASLQLIADTQYGELMGSVSFNRKLLGIVPPGIYRGFNFAIQGATTLRICPAGTGANNAVIERDGQVINVLGQNPIDVTIPRSQEVAVVIEAFSAHGVLTKQIDKNAAVEAAQIKVVPVAQVLGHQVTICTVNLPSTGNLAAAHISTATRKMGGLLNSYTIEQALAMFLQLSKMAGGRKGDSWQKLSGADHDYGWANPNATAEHKAKATHIFEFWRNRYWLYEQYGLEPKQLTDLLTTGRPGNATYMGAFGLATAAANEPRIDYDPVTGECYGLLSEPARTRLTTYPEDMTQSTNTANWQSVAAKSLVTTPGETCYSRKAFTKFAGEKLTAVWELTGDEQTPVLLTIDNGTTAHCGRVTFNLLNGQLTGIQSQGDFSETVAKVTPIIGGYRVELTTKTDSTLTGRLSLGVVAIGAVGGGGGSINVTRQWVERSEHSTTAILDQPASSTTRLSDAGNTSMPFKMTARGTIFLWARVIATSASSMTLAIRNSDNDYVGLQYCGFTNGTYSGATFVVKNGSAFSSLSAGNFKGEFCKIAFSWAPGRLATFHNGVKLEHGAGSTFPGFDLGLEYSLNFGGRSAGTVSSACTHIKEAWISPVETSDDELLALTIR